jgi:hypothetical protein
MSAELINAWIISYRGYSAADIATEQANLKRWLSTPYDAQSQGSKSYQKNMADLALRQSALQRVLNERSGQTTSVGIMDASDGIWGGQGVNTGLCGYPNSTDW